MNPFITQKDSFDAADVLYQPPLLSLPAVCPPTALHRRLLGGFSEYVRDQGMQPTCTAMALASVIDFLVLQREQLDAVQLPPADADAADAAVADARCSARMLYEMAKAFDEYPDDDNKGSSLRGAIKGFYHNGVYRRPHDERTERAEWNDPDWIFDIAKAQQSRQTILGHYARLGPSILDYQAAIAQVGIIYASASIHTGWQLDAVRERDGVIAWDAQQTPLGNHAFALIGYNESGFLVLNSAGIDWGCWRDPRASEVECWQGVALWPYDDWSRNILDAWVLRLGVPIEMAQFRRLELGRLESRRWGGFAGQGVTRLFVNGHYLHVADGQLVNSGVFANDQASIEQTAALLETIQPASPDGRPRRKYSDLVLIVESGLDSLEAMTRRCAGYAARLLADPDLTEGTFRPYPLSVIWRRDVLQVTEDLLASRAQRIEARTGGYADAKAHMLDVYAREFLQPIWRAFEGEAERSFQLGGDDRRGQAWPAMRRLLAAAAGGDLPMGVHLVVHGSGMPWLQALVERLVPPPGSSEVPVPGLESVEQRRRLLRSVTLLAPICTPERLLRLLDQLWGEWSLPDGTTPRPLAIYAQPAGRDAEESLGGYQGSFLELARRCFPLDGNLPTFTHPNVIAGHAEGLRRLSQQLGGRGLLDTLQRDAPAPIAHADLLNCPELVHRVFQRLKARSMAAG